MGENARQLCAAVMVIRWRREPAAKVPPRFQALARGLPMRIIMPPKASEGTDHEPPSISDPGDVRRADRGADGADRARAVSLCRPEIGELPFDAIEAVVTATLGFGVYAALFG